MENDLTQVKQEKDERFVESSLMLFELELRELVNRHSIDTVLDMPDFLIAEYIVNMLRNNRECIKKLFAWRHNGFAG